MPPLRSSSSSNALNTAYSLSLLTEYTNNLDTLPIELSRNFADLRELDAVLSSSMSLITTKINALTTMIEEGTIAKEERLWLLTEIASEAARLKPGADDKIRVACQAADNLKSHSAHLRTLLEHLPSFDTTTLNRKTTYPHVAPRSFMPSANTENGRRRRGGLSSMLASAPDPSPPKRKRVSREDDDVQRTPKKDRTGDGAAKQRNGRRAPKRSERAVSPAESLLSVTSHIPAHPTNNNNSATSRMGANSIRGNGSNPAPPPNKRSRPSQNNVNDHHGGRQDQHAHNNGNARRDMFNAPPSSSSSHPSLPLPYGGTRNDTHGYDLHHTSNDWLPAHQLEGPGMPVARAQSVLPSVMAAAISVSSIAPTSGGQDVSGDGEGEAEGDDKTYCFCDGISYGEMIACDDSTCEREWFHLACIGLTVPPEGTWYCETCWAKRNTKRSNRGGKRRTGGGGASRAGGKSAGAA